VVDLWADHADAAQTHPWTRDTIVNVASATKGLTAICAHRLVDRGLLDLEAPSPPTGPNSPRPARPTSRCTCC
jgi:CubicO group peptidase (beta-lactamase class C family)